MSGAHPSGIFIPDENSTPFSLDLLQTSERLTIKVGSWNQGGEAGEDLQLIKLKNGGWLLKVKYQALMKKLIILKARQKY